MLVLSAKLLNVNVNVNMRHVPPKLQIIQNKLTKYVYYFSDRPHKHFVL